jgi:hypothetical protein
MRCGSVTYKKRVLTSINPRMESDSEEIGITIFLDEADKAQGITAQVALEHAKKFVEKNIPAMNSELIKELIAERNQKNK